MNNNLIQIKVKQRLNKLDSHDYDNLECWKIQEAFNTAQLEWCRRQIDPVNPNIAGSEQTTRRVDDLQILLTPKNLTGFNKFQYFESSTLPSDYLAFKRVSVKGKKDPCGLRSFNVYLAQEADADVLLGDKNTQPNFEWGETFCTLFGNKIRIYTNDEFKIEDPLLVYYRNPKRVEFINCVDPSSGAIYTKEQMCEFKDDIVELLIDEASSLLGGDIEAMTQYQRNTSNAERNN